MLRIWVIVRMKVDTIWRKLRLLMPSLQQHVPQIVYGSGIPWEPRCHADDSDGLLGHRLPICHGRTSS